MKPINLEKPKVQISIQGGSPEANKVTVLEVIGPVDPKTKQVTRLDGLNFLVNNQDGVTRIVITGLGGLVQGSGEGGEQKSITSAA